MDALLLEAAGFFDAYVEFCDGADEEHEAKIRDLASRLRAAAMDRTLWSVDLWKAELDTAHADMQQWRADKERLDWLDSRFQAGDARFCESRSAIDASRAVRRSALAIRRDGATE